MMQLFDGTLIPEIGMGTFGSDRFGAEEVAAAVKNGIKKGYRLIDCARCYGNEKEIGTALQELFSEGAVERKDLFIMSKVWNDMHRQVEKSVRDSIADLQCEYLDMYFIHWPVPNYHAPGCSVDSRNPDSKPFSVEEFMDTYRQCEACVEKGLIKHIGISNMTVSKLEKTLPLMKIRPAAHEFEMHPCFQQEELLKFTKAQGILPIAYMPMGSPRRPDRDICPGDAEDLKEPALLRIAENHGIHPATVALLWAHQRGTLPIPFSVHEKNYLSNLHCFELPALTEEEMKEIGTLECGSRLVKGQVFLWPGAKDWQDLWE